MTVAVGRPAPSQRRDALLAPAAGLALLAAIVLNLRAIARLEALTSTWLIRVTGLARTQAIGTAVTYRLGHQWVGFTITGGCSVALLIIPPVVLTAVLIGLRRVSWSRGLLSTACAVVLLAAINQIRLYVIAVGMREWGFTSGYERTHIFIGSAITTVGLALVTIMFLLLLARGGRRRG